MAQPALQIPASYRGPSVGLGGPAEELKDAMALDKAAAQARINQMALFASQSPQPPAAPAPAPQAALAPGPVGGAPPGEPDLNAPVDSEMSDERRRAEAPLEAESVAE